MTVAKSVRESIRRFLNDQSGQAATEYILIIGLVSIPLVIAYDALHDSIKQFLVRIAHLFRGPGI
jgi:Flp pilus assembly pilin Flp